MTVTSTVRKVERLGDGATTAFPFSFRFYDPAHLRVSIRDAAGDVAETADYTLAAGAGSALDGYEGGTITYPATGTPLASGTSIIIELIPPLTQTGIDLDNASGFNPKAAERQYDLLTQTDQWLAGRPQILLDPADGPLTLPRRVAGRFIAATPSGLAWYPPDVTFDASGVTFESVTVAQTLVIDASAIYCLGYSSAGDGGAAMWVAVESEPSHPGKFQDAAGTWFELAADPVTPEMFGAVGDGVTDDLAAFTAAIAYCTSKGGGVIRPGQPTATYGISGPIVNATGSRILLYGAPVRTEEGSIATIRKLPGFSGEAAVIWGANPGTGQASALRGGGVVGWRIYGNDQEGGGFVARKTSACTFADIDVEYNYGGWAFTFDGNWITTLRDLTARRNGGGFRFSNTERKVTNLWAYNLHSTRGAEGGLLVECHPTDILLRPSDLNFFGGIIEFSDPFGDLASQPNPLARLEGGREISFYGVAFKSQGASAESVQAPCLILGKAGHTLETEFPTFYGCEFQHGWTGAATAFCVTFEGPSKSAVFHRPTAVLDSGDRFLDATSLPETAQVLVDSANVWRGGVADRLLRTDLTDPNGRVALRDGGLFASFGTGAQARIGVTGADQFDFGRYVSGTWQSSHQTFGGSDDKAFVFNFTDPQFTPRTGAEIAAMTPGPGRVVYWDGTGAAPDGGLNGPGLYLRVGSAWVFVGARNILSHVAITYAASVEIDFTALANKPRSITLTGDLELTGANYVSGAGVALRLVSGGASRNLTFPSGWAFMGTKPTAIAANKTAILYLFSWGTAEAAVTAVYNVQA